jgi:hypothetical protein
MTKVRRSGRFQDEESPKMRKASGQGRLQDEKDLEIGKFPR